MSNKAENKSPVPERLIQSALECFLKDDYHKVSTRQISATAKTNVSMIRYYFGNKEGLYEEMIRQTLEPLLDVLETTLLSSTGGFEEYFKIYYHSMQKNPRFPNLILKVLALKQGPGRKFIYQLLERGRDRSKNMIDTLKTNGIIDQSIDADVVRIAFVSLAMMPVLLKDVFEKQMEQPMNTQFFNMLAIFNGDMFQSNFQPK